MQRTLHSLIAITANIVANILRRTEGKTEDVLEEDEIEFRRGKGSRDAIGMLGKISERTLDIDEELCACNIEWQKAFDSVNWVKLMQILEKKWY